MMKPVHNITQEHKTREQPSHEDYFSEEDEASVEARGEACMLDEGSENVDLENKSIKQDKMLNLALKTELKTGPPDLESPYYCKDCSKSFKTERMMMRHLSSDTHKVKGRFSCAACGTCFMNRALLRDHELIHTDVRPHKCTICGSAFHRKSNLTKHYAIHCEERAYSCSLCSKKFRTSSAVTAHHITHTGERNYTCTYCNKTFSTSGNLQTHQLRQHSEQINGEARQMMKCEHCPKEFRTISGLDYHLKTILHTVYNCPGCPSKFHTEKSLKTHQKSRRHEGLPIVENVNNRPKMKHQCEHCGKVFKIKNNLKKHYQEKHPTRRVPAKRFACSICKKDFKTTGALKAHLLTHNGTQNFKCEFCNKMFSTAGNLKIHQLQLHHQEMGIPEKPVFQCAKCSKCFHTKSGLVYHSKSLHADDDTEDTSSCAVCKKEFYSKENLVTHQKLYSHHAEDDEVNTEELRVEVIGCSVCNQLWKYKDLLTAHKRDVHHYLTHEDIDEASTAEDEGQSVGITAKIKLVNNEFVLYDDTDEEDSVGTNNEGNADTKATLKEEVTEDCNVNSGYTTLYCKHCTKTFDTASEFRIHKIVCEHFIVLNSMYEESEQVVTQQ